LGKVKTQQVKRLAKELMDRFPDKFTNSFDDNKRSVSELTKGATTRVRNQIAGYITSSYTEEEETEVGTETPVEEAEP